MGKYIRLKASTFHSSALINEWMNKWIFHFPTNSQIYPWNEHIRKETTFLPEKKKNIYISLLWNTNKAQRNEGNLK